MSHSPTSLVIIGSGAWGTTLALVAQRAGTHVTLVARNDHVYEGLCTQRMHPGSLQGIHIPEEIRISRDAETALPGADAVLFAVPTQQLRSSAAILNGDLRGKLLITAAKGIEIGTALLPTQILADSLGDVADTPLVALSGPNLAMEIAQGKPATTVVASHSSSAVERVQSIFMGESFRVYTSRDVIGVQIGGALKNIIAIGAGIGDGFGTGDNAKAAFLTRGIAEIARLGAHLGADPLTFAGLSGIGDLICTCSSGLSRNHRVGVEIAQGRTLQDILATMPEVAEGVPTTKAAVEMARTQGIVMPIAEQMFSVLFEGKSPAMAIRDLMMRDPRAEEA